MTAKAQIKQTVLSNQKLIEARKRLDDGKRKEAWHLLSEALALNPQNDPAWKAAFDLLSSQEDQRTLLNKWMKEYPDSALAKEIDALLVSRSLSPDASRSTRKLAVKRRWRTFYLALGTILILIAIAYLFLNFESLGLSGGAILALFVLLYIAPDVIDRLLKKSEASEDRALRGAQAEAEIGVILSKLPTMYEVLHDIESPYGNIDHLVISRTGNIFLIETKSHSGRVNIRGQNITLGNKAFEKDFIKQVHSNVFWLKETITNSIGTEVWINPILAFTNAFVPISKPIRGIHVLNAKFLIKQITRINSSNKGNPGVWVNRGKIMRRLVR